MSSQEIFIIYPKNHHKTTIPLLTFVKRYANLRLANHLNRNVMPWSIYAFTVPKIKDFFCLSDIKDLAELLISETMIHVHHTTQRWLILPIPDIAPCCHFLLDILFTKKYFISSPSFHKDVYGTPVVIKKGEVRDFHVS